MSCWLCSNSSCYPDLLLVLQELRAEHVGRDRGVWGNYVLNMSEAIEDQVGNNVLSTCPEGIEVLGNYVLNMSEGIEDLGELRAEHVGRDRGIWGNYVLNMSEGIEDLGELRAEHVGRDRGSGGTTC